MDIPLQKNRKNLVSLPQAAAYGFILPVMVEESLWRKNYLFESSVNSQSIDCLLETYADELKKHASRTDIVFDCKIRRDSHSEPNNFAIELESSLEFDRSMKPYLMIKYH